jgi:shikimate 5-dehydrogenase
LVGYNTDGEGFVESLFAPQPDRVKSFIGSLKNMDVILLGAGGSARAVAFHVADLLDGGRLLICNRTSAHAETLASDVNRAGGKAEAILESELFHYVPRVGLVVNSTTKGQGGVRKLDQNRVTVLEGYSALAPANPPVFPDLDYGKPTFQSKWTHAASADIEANHKASMRLAKSIPQQAGFYDLIYYPEETVFLRHGRETGHATMNGKAMIVNQAVFAFTRVCHSELAACGINTPDMHREILEVMYLAW